MVAGDIESQVAKHRVRNSLNQHMAGDQETTLGTGVLWGFIALLDILGLALLLSCAMMVTGTIRLQFAKVSLNFKHYKRKRKATINGWSVDQVISQGPELHTEEDCTGISIDLSTDMKLTFLETATMTCLEARDCVAVKIIRILVYEIVKATLQLNLNYFPWPSKYDHEQFTICSYYLHVIATPYFCVSAFV